MTVTSPGTPWDPSETVYLKEIVIDGEKLTMMNWKGEIGRSLTWVSNCSSIQDGESSSGPCQVLPEVTEWIVYKLESTESSSDQLFTWSKVFTGRCGEMEERRAASFESELKHVTVIIIVSSLYFTPSKSKMNILKMECQLSSIEIFITPI